MAKVKKPVYGKKGGKSKKRTSTRKKGKGQGIDDGLIATIIASILSQSGRAQGQTGGLTGTRVFQPGQTTPASGPGPRPVFAPGPQLPSLEALAQEQRGRIGDISAGPDVQAQTGQISNLVNQLRGFQAKGGNLVSQLQDFQPLQGPARGTLDEILQSGLPTDVGGITEAASIRAGQEFESLSDKINERLASQGLLSSTARTGQIAKAKGQLAERVGAAGLEAGVSAAEAASGRRQAGVGQALGVSGQQLGAQGAALTGQIARSGQQLAAQQAALGGAGTAAGLNLQAGQGNQAAQLAASQGRAGAGQRFISSPPVFTGQTQGLFAQPTGGQAPPTGGGLAGSATSSSQNQLGSIPVPQRGGITSNTNPANPGFIGNTSPRSAFGQEGGAVPDPKFEEFLVNIGRKISQAFGPFMHRDPDPTRKRETDIKIAISNLGGPEGAFQLFSNPQLKDQATRLGLDLLKKGKQSQQTTASGDPLVTALVKGFHNLQTLGKPIRQKVTSGASELTGAFGDQDQGPKETTGEATRLQDLGGVRRQVALNALRSNPASSQIFRGGELQREFVPQEIQGFDEGQTKAIRESFPEFLQGFQEGGPVQQNTVPITRLSASPQDLGILFPTLEDPRRSFFGDGGGAGGEVPGQDTGQDVVPAMLRSEELVVTPELVERIEQVETPLEAMQIIRDLQQLAQKPLEFNPGEGEFIGQAGGRTTGASTLPPDVLQRLATVFGRLTGGEAIPPLDVEELGRKFAEEQAVPTLQGPLGQGIPDISGIEFLPPPPIERTPQSIIGGQVVGGEPIGGAKGPSAPPQVPADFLPPTTQQDTVPGPEEFPPSAPEPFVPSQFSQGMVDGVPTFNLEGGTFGGPTVVSPGRGTFSELGAKPTTREERRLGQLDAARRRQELITIAFNTDPVGGPVKQAALSNALQNAERQIASITDEIAKEEKAKADNLQSAALAAGAQASLDNAVSFRLNAETQRATALSEITAQIQAAAAVDIGLADALNIVAAAKGVEDPKILSQLSAVLDAHFKRHDIEIPGGITGWIKKVLFGSTLAGIPEDSVPLGPEGAASRESDRLIQGVTQSQFDGLQEFGAL